MASALIQSLLWPNPPHAPSGVGLMMHFDSSTTAESTGYPPANITAPNPTYTQIANSVYKFSGGSLYVASAKSMFDSGGGPADGYVVIAPSGTLLQLSTVTDPDKWCVECWIRPTMPPATQWSLIWAYGCYGNGGDNYVYLQLYLGSLIYSIGGGSSTTPLFSVTHPTTITNDGVWHHIACVRNGTSYNIYLDGVGATPYVYGGWSIPISTTYGLHIGCGNHPSTGFSNPYYPYFGYIDDFRLTAGNPVYTANFTPSGPLLPP